MKPAISREMKVGGVTAVERLLEMDIIAILRCARPIA